LGRSLPWNGDFGTRHFLESVAKHGTVHFIGKVGGDFNGQVWPDPDEIGVVRRVMNFAK
jgi:hypothetical protein